MLRVVVLAWAMLTLAGCELGEINRYRHADAGSPDPDAAAIPPPDAFPPPGGDAASDAGPITHDGGLTTHHGTVQILETTIAGHPELGRGLRIDIDLVPLERAADFEEMPGSPLGCRAWIYELALGDTPPAGGDEGALTVTGTSAPVPPCSFLPGSGYQCVASAGAADATVLDDSDGPPGLLPADTALVTITDATFTDADLGRWLTIVGSTHAANDGTFPIVGVPAQPDRLVIANPAAATEPGAYPSTWRVSAGMGPAPGVSLDAIGDADLASVDLLPGGAGHFDWDPWSPPFPVDAGDAFTLDASTLDALTSGTIMSGGNAVTLSCSGAGGSCGAATGTMAAVTTTDADVAGTPDDYFPAPLERQVVISCIAIGPAGTIVVPAPAMALLAGAAPTRIRASYSRVGVALGLTSTGYNNTNVFVGHGVIAFATP